MPLPGGHHISPTTQLTGTVDASTGHIPPRERHSSWRAGIPIPPHRTPFACRGSFTKQGNFSISRRQYCNYFLMVRNIPESMEWQNFLIFTDHVSCIAFGRRVVGGTPFRRPKSDPGRDCRSPNAGYR
ncbi:hypothetical protein VFPPC_18076 [Pochonia chlamydosporia 170]|uniref:Uncharacterized protein n=1 Tax=Pochonia chlamydosporia 170 TaxID=1380566 RepID=A0A219APH1_METCM|nr:hypothetical protein VFPPC_18076 [Pochonia chlamydosporia 170]OWT42663.1 hypothetical protein VFPPC_18076 [Pochonia chlamydosporia 170]